MRAITLLRRAGWEGGEAEGSLDSIEMKEEGAGVDVDDINVSGGSFEGNEEVQEVSGEEEEEDNL